MVKIDKVVAREILDSRGLPTIETYIVLDNGIWAYDSVPAGTSRGANEALELRDDDKKRFRGMGVLKAVDNVNSLINKNVRGMDPTNQLQIDNLLNKLDGTENKSKLGANAILSVSLAVARVSSYLLQKPLFAYLNQVASVLFDFKTKIIMPSPLFNMINGGLHGAENLDFQEFHIITNRQKPFYEALEIGAEIYQLIKETLISHKAVHTVGEEGGFAPTLFNNTEALRIFIEAITKSPYKFGLDLFIGLDIGASHFAKGDKYYLKDKSAYISADDLIEQYKELNQQYHFLLIEDGISENDWASWAKLNQVLGGEALIVGDDLVCTNIKLIKKAIEGNCLNAVIIKPNQIGTISETIQTVKFCKEKKLYTIMSHRSGETDDTFIADLGVALSTDYVKFGAPCRGERVIKYNRLLQIEMELEHVTQQK
jgi:enolase